MTTLVKGKNIDTSKITFSAPKILDNGAKLVYMNYNGGRLSIQSPWMSMPWKMGVYEPEGGGYPKYSVDLTFKGMEDNPDLLGFHDKLLELENKIIEAGVENSVAWFKKKTTSKDVVDALFSKMIKVSTDRETGEPDGKWPPTMKLKVPRRDNDWETKVQDKDGKVFNINEKDGDNLEEVFIKNTRMRAIIQCVGLWVSNKNYMCQWKLTKAEVEVPESSGQHEFLEDSDDEGDVAPDTFIEDSSSDKEGSDKEGSDKEGSDKEEVTTEPVKKRKVVRKKKVTS